MLNNNNRNKNHHRESGVIISSNANTTNVNNKNKTKNQHEEQSKRRKQRSPINNTIIKTTTTTSNESSINKKDYDNLKNVDDLEIIADHNQSSSAETIISSSCQKCNHFDQFNHNSNVEQLQICLCRLELNTHILPEHRLSRMLFENPGQIYNYLNRCRRWVQVWRPKDPSMLKQYQEFSVTTYNILSQNLLLNHLYLYQDNNRSDLEWLERSNRLKKELIELNSDIYCLQEVHMENFHSTIAPSMKKRGYKIICKQKTGENLDGCSILFKENKFQLQDSLEIEMNRTDISKLLDKEQIGLAVKLRPLARSTDTNLIVANTHLLFNPRRGDIKLAQLRLLLAEIQRFAVNKKSSSDPNEKSPRELEYSPIILCGDFNSEPESPLIQFIKNGEMDFQSIKCGNISGQRDGIDNGRFISQNDLLMNGIDKNSCFTNTAEENSKKESKLEDYDLTVKHVFKFKSAYPSVDDFNLKFVSTSTFYDCGLVDYVFYSDKHKNLRFGAFRRLLTSKNLKKIGNLPNSILGSDHMSLSAKFYID